MGSGFCHVDLVVSRGSENGRLVGRARVPARILRRRDLCLDSIDVAGLLWGSYWRTNSESSSVTLKDGSAR